MSSCSSYRTSSGGRYLAVLMVWLMICVSRLAGAGTERDLQDQVQTSVGQILKLLKQHGKVGCSVSLRGYVLLVEPQSSQFIFQDESGGMMVQVDQRDFQTLQPGQEISIEGEGLVFRDAIVSRALIDNDGVHASQEKTESIYLPAGLYPISVEWFNRLGLIDLSLEWRGPNFPRQRIPDSMLSHSAPATNENGRFISGLNCFVYEGEWQNLPDFSQLSAVRSSMIENVTLQPRTRDDHVGLVFQGYFRVPESGEYTFWLKSDDGSRLEFGNPLRIMQLARGNFPLAQRLPDSRAGYDRLNNRWTQVEGVIVRVIGVADGASVELNSNGERLWLKVADADYISLKQLAHSKITAKGVFQNAGDIDGQPVSLLLVPNATFLGIAEPDATVWSDFPSTILAALTKTNLQNSKTTIVHVSGTVSSNRLEDHQVIQDGNDFVRIAGDKNFSPGQQIEALGWLRQDGGEAIIHGAFGRVVTEADVTNGLPLLEKAIQVKSLSRSEAQRGYPVKIRGVVTATTGGDENFVIQDSTWSVFCYWDSALGKSPPKIGEEWEIEGRSDVHFAPDVMVKQAEYLRPGILPDPIRPTRDELVNGSLDTQFIEMQGVATAMEDDNITLWTREGKMRFNGSGFNQQDGMKNAMVRIRGVFVPDRDVNQMMQPTAASFRLFNASVNVDELAPADPFDAALKHPSDFRFFDAQADVLRRVKVMGQVLCGKDGTYFLMDGKDGLRFEPQDAANLQPGDLVEVVGFPDVSGVSPILHESLIRAVGSSALLAPQHLNADAMLDAKLDSTLVSLESRLVSLGFDRSGAVMGLQSGDRSYLARFCTTNGDFAHIQLGSLLELTGVYVALGNASSSPSGYDVDSFELLINSPSDIQVLARPPWWSLRHTLMVCGGMALIILLAVMWITQLRRQVEERSRQLAVEIKNREQLEYQRALDAERTRIAQDLHDELGARLTEIRFMGAIRSRDVMVPENTRHQLGEVSEKARQMVSSLDEIVWAVNPANDSLPNLANYLCHLAVELLRNTEIRFRFDSDDVLPPLALTSEVRHNICLVVREAFNNIVKHSGATEAWLRIHSDGQTVNLTIEDNGHGFSAENTERRGNGLANMNARLEKIGGKFICDSRPGVGTICRVELFLLEARK